MKKNDQRMIKIFLSSVVTILLFTNGMAVLADDSSTDMTGMSDVTQKAPAEDMEQSNRQTAELAIRSTETVDSTINSFQETDLKVQEKEDAAAAVQTESASIDSNEQGNRSLQILTHNLKRRNFLTIPIRSQCKWYLPPIKKGLC